MRRIVAMRRKGRMGGSLRDWIAATDRDIGLSAWGGRIIPDPVEILTAVPEPRSFHRPTPAGLAPKRKPPGFRPAVHSVRRYRRLRGREDLLRLGAQGAGGVQDRLAQLLHGADLDLAHPLARDVELVAQRLQRHRLLAQTPLQDDLAL